jgi:hypothetical protein
MQDKSIALLGLRKRIFTTGRKKERKKERFFTTESTEITEEEGIKLVFFLPL